MELESDNYDVVVVGTGLAESIAAASLAKSGKSVLHLDPNDYYGGEQASLTLDELQLWAETRAGPLSSPTHSTSASTEPHPPSAYVSSQRQKYSYASTTPLSEQLESDRRRYALSLFPAVVPSRGKLIDVLIASNVSKYVSFRMLDSVSVWQAQGQDGEQNGEGQVKRVPGSKEEVFKDKSVGLADKRRLMKFLMFAAGDFENDEILKGKETQPLLSFLQESFSIPIHLATQLTYAIAHCSSSEEETFPALQRTRRYLKSIGRYGSGAFLVGQYGGAGEVAQGFCRACAVFGGTYILGPSSIPDSTEIVTEEDGRPVVKLKLPCHPRVITAKHLITSPDHLPFSLISTSSTSTRRISAHCTAIVSALPEALRWPPKITTSEADGDAGEEEQGAEGEEDDAAIVVFPPEGENGVVRAIMMGEGTGSCPAGQYILYLSTESSTDQSASISSDPDPKRILQPYLKRLSPDPLFEAYHLSTFTATSSPITIVDAPSPATSQSSPLVILEPYSGSQTATEGMDWEASQGEAAFWAVVGQRDNVEEGEGFFDKTEADEQDEELS